MKSVLPYLFFLAACAPDIKQNPPPPRAVVVEFDPGAGIVPLPNDLARDPLTGKVVVPPSATDTPAQTEFNQDYLGSLTGFPFESIAQVLLNGAVDPSTLVSQNVVVLDITAATAVRNATPILDLVADAIDIAPPPGGWTRNHQYAIALIAGAGRLAGAHGEPVIGSPTWALVSSPNPLVTCAATNGALPDLTSPCEAAVDVIPSNQSDPGLRLRDQAQKATQLERIREGYAPLLSQVEQLAGVDRTHIPILWTFTIVDAGEVTFDPANRVIPFPNDVLRTNGSVALPNPTTGMPLTPADCATATASVLLYCGLNTLDGFSTIAAPISENGPGTDAVAQAHVDASRLSPQSVGLIPVASAAPAAEQTAVAYTPCLNCLSSKAADGTPQTSPEQLQWRLDRPLDERTTYLAYVTSSVKDDQGKSIIANPVFALTRSKAPIAVNGKSQVSILSDAQALQLEPLRVALKPALDKLEAGGLPRSNVTLAWAFTTQSEATVLDEFHAYVASLPPAQYPPGAVIFADATTQYLAAARATSPAIPVAAIANVYVGVFVTPVAVTGLGGAFDLSSAKPEPVTFALAIPATMQPPAGYPVTIFGHGFTRDRNDFLGIANSLAQAGQATIATDALFHGERTSCTGARAFLSQALGASVSDDAACADPSTMRCNEDPLIGRCVARVDATRVACPGLGLAAGPDPTGNLGCQQAQQGACLASTKTCEGGDFKRDSGGRPVISGWNIFSLSNFFATRDNFRQQVIDLSQLVRTLQLTGGLKANIRAAGGTASLDLATIGYVGQSLGGILGTLFNAVSADTTNVVLNVPGGDLSQIILVAPSFAAQKKALLAALALQSPPVLPGTPAFDQFVSTAQWILDPADPANMGWRLTHPVGPPGGVAAPNANRKAFIQFIEGDGTVPNEANFALVSAAADQSFSPSTPPAFGCSAPLFCYEFTGAIDGFDTNTVPLANRHGFLLRPPAATPEGLALTTKAQNQATRFLATGALP